MAAAIKDLASLNKHMSTRSYITGYEYGKDDDQVFGRLGADALGGRSSAPHAYRWAHHISALQGNVFKKSAEPVKAVTSAGKPAKKAAPVNDDFDDMFGDEPLEDLNEDGETAAEAAATKARRERMEKARKLKEEADAKAGKKKKEKEAEKSLVVLEIKPWEADTDLEMVWNEIRKHQQEGLSWGEKFELQPVAYGIKKLVMTCTIVDKLVLMDDITDAIEALEDYVQSVQVASMNKI